MGLDGSNRSSDMEIVLMALKDKKIKHLNINLYHEPIGDEIEVFSSAYTNKLPILLQRSDGMRKTRFVEFMAWKLKQRLIHCSLP